jgi:hypothetical protein
MGMNLSGLHRPARTGGWDYLAARFMTPRSGPASLWPLAAALSLLFILGQPAVVIAQAPGEGENQVTPQDQKEKTKKKSKKSAEGKASKKDSIDDQKAKEKEPGAEAEKGKTFPKGPREAEFKEALGGGYKVQYTDHFFVMYNVSDEVVRNFISRLEKTYDSVHRFATQMEIRLEYPSEKLPVIFCNNYEEYNQRCLQLVGHGAPADAAGLYWHDPANFSIFYDMSQVKPLKEKAEEAKRLKEQALNTRDRKARKSKLAGAQYYENKIDQYQQEQNRSVVQHEVSHQLLFNLGVHSVHAPSPQWFVEGMATQFEPPPGKMGAGFNVINQRRLQDLRSLPGNKIPDLRGFVGKPGTGGMLSNDGYAFSWALTYYLVKKKTKQLHVYVALLKKRKPGAPVTAEEDIADFEKCFGKIDNVFQKRWATFIKNLPARSRR